ncbi:hypothetical protein M0811_13470 [Anaeramoeba ignava]|uniref:Uncharacterized protein n=1 Tax=Anaeramoeba ignava TaxID=1746090 RepID=A0A9Q0L737_ANAIG|nr:hypothetical protein M0811_13470 [Anaeramoeba ignava]
MNILFYGVLLILNLGGFIMAIAAIGAFETNDRKQMGMPIVASVSTLVVAILAVLLIFMKKFGHRCATFFNYMFSVMIGLIIISVDQIYTPYCANIKAAGGECIHKSETFSAGILIQLISILATMALNLELSKPQDEHYSDVDGNQSYVPPKVDQPTKENYNKIDDDPDNFQPNYGYNPNQAYNPNQVYDPNQTYNPNQVYDPNQAQNQDQNQYNAYNPTGMMEPQGNQEQKTSTSDSTSDTDSDKNDF